MPEVNLTGPAGRLEGRYQPSRRRSDPIAIILHPHPRFGGTMNNQIVYQLFYMFTKRDFSVLRFTTKVRVNIGHCAHLAWDFLGRKNYLSSGWHMLPPVLKYVPRGIEICSR